VGGGTDLPSHYLAHSGSVVSAAIDKYVYITVNDFSRYYGKSIMLKYSKTEMVHSVDEVEHPIIRECLKMAGVLGRVEITSMADIPAGTGLGSSSSFTVGLLSALYAHKGEVVSTSRLAEEACVIELEKVGSPIGKQDQYAAAYGGFNCIKFNKDGSVFVDPVICSNSSFKKLENNLLMFYTGVSRKATDILSIQNSSNHKNSGNLIEMGSLCEKFLDALSNNYVDEVGNILHEGWERKKSLVDLISNLDIDFYYQKALDAGAFGGKLLGAGGGGFLLLYTPEDKKDEVRCALLGLELIELKVNLGTRGSCLIYISNN
jgi:D-glycero-alpha-D-manno-heptose-7-phosphate kinase